MPQSLTDNQIALTYKGVIHAQGAELPSNGTVNLCDGNGNASSLSIGKTNGGLSITGGLTAGQLSYPTTTSTNGYILAQINSQTVALTSINEIMRTAGAVADGTYSGVQNIVIQNGIITSINVAPRVLTLFLDLETFSPLLSAESNDTSKSIYPYGNRSSQLITSISPQLILENYLNVVWNGSSTLYGSPNNSDIAIIIVPDTSLYAIGSTRNYLSFVYGIMYKYTSGSWVWQRYLCHHYHGADNGDYSDYNDSRHLRWNTNSTTTATASTYHSTINYNDNVVSVVKERNGL